MRDKPKLHRKMALLLFVFVLAFLYTASRIKVVEIGYAVSNLKEEVAEMERENGILRSQIASTRSTQKLMAWTQKLHFHSPSMHEIFFVEVP